MIRTGKDYMDKVRDGRTIYLDGQLVEDAVDHPRSATRCGQWRVSTILRRRLKTKS